MPRRRPGFGSGEAGAEVAQPKGLGDAGGSQKQRLSDAGRADFSIASSIATAETKVPPTLVWRAWNQAHSIDTSLGIPKKQGKFSYLICDVKRGEQFSIRWKTLFVRLIFTYRVQPLYSGSQLSTQVQVKGVFGWLVRRMIGRKLNEQLATVLKDMVAQLEGRC